MTSATSLLRDWDLLQTLLMPALLQVAPRRAPRVWTIGTPEDAVALTAAYHHASGDAGPADIRVFLSWPGHRRTGSERVHFALADIRCLPWSSRSRSFRREERRWVPNPELTEHVILSDPFQPVDLLTIRARPWSEEVAATRTAEALGRVRRGGLLLFSEPAPRDLVPTGDFRRVEPHGRLYERVNDAALTSSGPPPDPRAPAPLTLANREQQAHLVETHYNLARSLARRFSHHGEMADDLEQVALLALVKAAGRYSPDHGSSFATFATASVLGELKRHFRDRTWMLRVPRSLQETYLAVKAAREELGQTLGTSPTVQQIAEHLGVSDEAVLSAMEAGDSYWPASLDAPRRGDEDAVTEVPAGDPGFDASLDRRQLRETLPKLERREQLIVKRLYFDGWTQRRVAQEIGVSQMQVSRLMARTLEKLREAFAET